MSRADSSAQEFAGLHLGLISGTSMDAVDAVLVDIGARQISTLHSLAMPYPADLRKRLERAIAPQTALTLPEIAMLDVEVGRHFANAANTLLERSGIAARSVIAIGSHGQTLHHNPAAAFPYSMQIGDGATIAARTGIITVCNFRALDVAYGGEGAPLVPPFHAWCWQSARDDRAIVNIGGIANLTWLPAGQDGDIAGYDTGPGNCLMDVWAAAHLSQPFDADGHWAASGTVQAQLLERLLSDPYFAAAPPKSTGREIYNRAYVDAALAALPQRQFAAADVQATLAALTIETIARALEAHGAVSELYVCGGGACNRHLMQGLTARLPGVTVESVARLGVDPTMVEACAFAWLAWMRMNVRPVPLTTAPGRRREVILGAIYLPTADLTA